VQGEVRRCAGADLQLSCWFSLRKNPCNLAVRRVNFLMSTVFEIIEAIRQLGDADKAEFLTRLTEIDFDEAWDRQIELDAKAGRLDHLWEQARNDIKNGRTKPLDEVLNDE
jgi:hypothetical protein